MREAPGSFPRAGAAIRRAAKLENPFSTYTKTRRDRSRRQRLQRSVYVSRGFRRVGTTTSIISWGLLGRGGGRGRSQNHTYLDGANAKSATIEVLVRRGRIFTGSAEEHTLAAAGTGAATFANESYALPK